MGKDEAVQLLERILEHVRSGRYFVKSIAVGSTGRRQELDIHVARTVPERGSVESGWQW